MAVADADVNPSPPPPPARIVVAVLVFVRFVLALMLAFGRVLLVAASALPYLGLATSWVFNASSAATVVARHVCREGSSPLVFLEAFTDAAFKAFICILLLSIALAVVLLCGLYLVSLVEAVSGSGSEFNKSAFGAITQESAPELIKLPRAVVLGLVADLAFVLLIVAGLLVAMMSPHVEGSISHGEMIASAIVDVGMLGLHAIFCFVIFPALALDIWRNGELGRKAEVTVANC